MLERIAGGMAHKIGRIGRALAGAALAGLFASAAEAKIPGHTHCYRDICHKVLTLAETESRVGHIETALSSYYDDCKVDRHNTCDLTSSGEVFRPGTSDNAASPIYPDGTVLLVRHRKNGKAAVVRVNSAGPYFGKRTLDVSRGTAEMLGFKARGVARLEVKVLYAPSASESRYKKHRHYDAVPGYIGTYASLDAAQAGVAVAFAKDATPLNRNSGLMHVANADLVISGSPAVSPGADTPADGLRAAARKAFGPAPDARRLAPATLTAEALYALMRKG